MLEKKPKPRKGTESKNFFVKPERVIEKKPKPRKGTESSMVAAMSR